MKNKRQQIPGTCDEIKDEERERKRERINRTDWILLVLYHMIECIRFSLLARHKLNLQTPFRRSSMYMAFSLDNKNKNNNINRNRSFDLCAQGVTLIPFSSGLILFRR
jgi:hypothetical protein